MAGTLITSFVLSGKGIGYYFSNWNTNPVSISVLVVLILLLSGYFYGRVFQRFIKPLNNIDTTIIGVLFIFAVFQMLTFYLVAAKGSTAIAYYTLIVLICISPFLCLVTWSNIIPTKKNLFSILLIIVFAAILGYGSRNLNTNNIYFDSITYLSEVVESSQNQLFAHMIFPLGRPYYALDPLHDYTGYYYLWGILLRICESMFGLKTTLTPIYIWGATFLYAALLAILVIDASVLLFRKYKWKGVLFTVALMAPYYTNYFNTTIAFFGNTIRTVVIGCDVMLVYLILKNTKSRLLFVPLTICHYAALNTSSSSLFLIAFITAGLAFSLALAKEKDWLRWTGFIASCLPLFHMVYLASSSWDIKYFKALALPLAAVAVLILVAFLIRKHLDLFDKGLMILIPVAFIGLAILAFLYRDGDFGYDYFFKTSSLDDMTVNMTSHVSVYELIRNLIFYALLLLTLFNFRVEKRFKLFLILIVLLFINPVVQPAISSYMTYGVYSRVFDILNNPFTLCFMLCSLDRLLSNQAVNWTVLILIALFSLKYGFDTLTTPYSKSLTVGVDDDWNWEAKVSNDSLDMYEYIKQNIATNSVDLKDFQYDERSLILSQDAGLKGYVPGIRIAFSTEDYRKALTGTLDPEYKAIGENMVALMYPDRKYTDDDYGDTGDYSKLGDLFLETNADFVVLNNTLAVWDDRGWFTKPYQTLVDKGLCQVIYENESLVLLRINQQWQAQPKSQDRYWVHMYE